jgi:membrane-bound metal-dependent hydrolase YbcI (DUF457 family)
MRPGLPIFEVVDLNARTHMLGGLAAGALVAPALAPGHTLAFLAAAVLAAPLPDIDHPASLYGRLLPLPGVARVHGRVEPYVRSPFGDVSRGQVGRVTPFGVLWHRGPAHSLFMALCLSALATVAASPVAGGEAWAVGLGVLVGMLSHLALDAMNVAGMELLWPFSRRRWRLPWPRVPVGGAGEVVVSGALVFVTLVLVRRLV